MTCTMRIRRWCCGSLAAAILGPAAAVATEPAAHPATEIARAEIARLPVAYAWAVDGRDIEAMLAIFTTDAVYDLSAYGFPDVRGHSALRRFFLESVFPSERCSFSSISNVRIEIDGEHATGGDYFLHFGYGNPKVGTDTRMHVEGQHYYEFRVEQGQWKIARMTGRPTFERVEPFAAQQLKHCSPVPPGGKRR